MSWGLTPRSTLGDSDVSDATLRNMEYVCLVYVCHVQGDDASYT